MAIATASPISITQKLPYSLLKKGKEPKFGNPLVKMFLSSASKTLQEARPDNISLVIAVAPDKKININERWYYQLSSSRQNPWSGRDKPDSITFYTFFKKDNTFAAIETISENLADIYYETGILPLTDAWSVKIAQNFLALSDEWRTRFTNSGCLIYSE
jgi:hypothetical protein